jgi:hypothetical protein
MSNPSTNSHHHTESKLAEDACHRQKHNLDRSRAEVLRDSLALPFRFGHKHCLYVRKQSERFESSERWNLS